MYRKNVIYTHSKYYEWQIFFAKPQWYLISMPQFDLNLLNFQNILVYIFCVSYLFYLKEINVYFFYSLKLPNRLNLSIFLLFFKKKWYWDQLSKPILSILSLLTSLKKMRFLSYILSIENNNILYYSVI